MTTTLIILVTLILIFIVVRYLLMIKKTGSMSVFMTSYKMLKERLPNLPEEEILKESFKPFTQRKPFNILEEKDVTTIIKTLEPSGPERYKMIALLILIADKKGDANFLLYPDDILDEIRKFYAEQKK